MKKLSTQIKFALLRSFGMEKFPVLGLSMMLA